MMSESFWSGQQSTVGGTISAGSVSRMSQFYRGTYDPDPKGCSLSPSSFRLDDMPSLSQLDDNTSPRQPGAIIPPDSLLRPRRNHDASVTDARCVRPRSWDATQAGTGQADPEWRPHDAWPQAGLMVSPSMPVGPMAPPGSSCGRRHA
ncbi:hypothetical protein PGTUg99_003604 [Puccinia graminis f. sp. tritici]|uniref:Uncharacterized protein n=1 Tax=Puccinia graminis f. sp. tritici TaxID=56615 RepID=A0A5B0QYC8_PUCGR|nr:hypothetical protein PGTUg99_003604 [Puccinia graminis f. sp. tritici]